jgi:hypothetical protein
MFKNKVFLVGVWSRHGSKKSPDICTGEGALISPVLHLLVSELSDPTQLITLSEGRR